MKAGHLLRTDEKKKQPSEENLLFDLDGTIAHYDGFKGPSVIGDPLGKGDATSAYEKLRAALQAGKDARIFTARVFPLGIDRSLTGLSDKEYQERLKQARVAQQAIDRWAEREFGKTVPTQCWKDQGSTDIFDDRAHAVDSRTGKILHA